MVLPSPPSYSTPLQVPSTRATSTSPSSSESSEIDELSFEYVCDDEGNIIRTSKGSAKSRRSSPPTPLGQYGELDFLDEPSTKPKSSQPTVTEPVSTSPPPRRASLSRSESAFPVLNGPATASSDRERDRANTMASNPARSFHRVASGPIPTTTSLNDGNALPVRTLPRSRIDQQYEARQKRHTEELRAKLAATESHVEEKENIRGSDDIPSVEEFYGSRPTASTSTAPSRYPLPTRAAYGSQSLGSTSRPLADVPVQRTLAGSSRKVLKGTGSKPTIDRISEVLGAEAESDGGEDAYAGYGDHGHGLTENNVYGPDTDNDDDEGMPAFMASRSHHHHPNQPPHSAGVAPLNQSGNTRPRRSASLSDNLLQEEDHHVPSQMAQPAQRQQTRPGTSLGLRRELPVLPPRRSIEDRQDAARDDYQLRTRQTPSPTSDAPVQQRPQHKRRDSDTLRSFQSHSSPTVVEPPSRLSPSNILTRTQSAGVIPPAKHRRSPTAPAPSTTSGSLQAGPSAPNVLGKTWASGDRSSGEGYDVPTSDEKDRDRDPRRERERGRTQQAQQQQTLVNVPQAKGPAPPPPNQLNQNQGYASSSQFNRQLMVNKKVFHRLDMIGKGGSSRVYRVMTAAHEVFALKRVSLDKTDAETMAGYMNEIALLKRLEGNSRIIRLIDSEVKAGPGGTKGHLNLLMECGEIDLARLLSERSQQALNMVWVAYYWQQMLQAVHVIHEEKIVHSDLKPANFVLVRGQLKLIDFGIANAIANDTTNIQRDHQIGTVNYMSPEAIELPDGMRRLKVGRSSDVWSLGCILYQMVYGQPPFQHLSVYQKMKAIPDASYDIQFPDYSVPVIPASKSNPQSQGEPRRLEHLRQKVRADVIMNMKSCLDRNAKERMTIPELLQEDWLAMKEPEPEPVIMPTLKDLLPKEDTIITPLYMKQLLQYGIRLGQQGTSDESESLIGEATRLVGELRRIQELD